MDKVIALLAGMIFGIGLIVSGMVNPANIQAFLDVTWLWNPSLALVMVGAIAIALPAFHLAKSKKQSLCGTAIQLPMSKTIDKRLIIGSVAFGAGWGLAGYCPAPALVSAATGQGQALVFTLAMLAGFYLFSLLEQGKPR